MIELKKAIDNQRLIEIWVEGEKWRDIDKRLYRRHLRKISLFISKEELSQFFSKKEGEIAFNYACRLLTLRGYLTNELKAKLEAKLISNEAIEEVLSKCEKRGYLDDAREISLFIKRSLIHMA